MKKVTSAAAKIAVMDEWASSAMTDVDMVAELLIRMKHAETVVAQNPAANLLPLRWGVRQRRSRSSRFAGVGPLATFKKDVDSARGSPMTPLSWSGGSGSGGGCSASPSDGFEDTSRQTSCSTSTASGSKAFHINDITSSCLKRLNKKKSSLELRGEENLKLKERRDLENEIANLQATMYEQNVRNQKLKRIKLDLNSGRLTTDTPVDLIRKSQHCIVEDKTASSENQGRGFFLPDLNMVPAEDEVL